MDSAAGPGLQRQARTRTALRLGGGVTAPVGVVLAIVGFTRFAGGRGRALLPALRGAQRRDRQVL